MKKLISILALAGVTTTGAMAENVTDHREPFYTLVSTSTFTAGKTTVHLGTWKTQDGRVCRRYVKKISTVRAEKGSETDIATDILCNYEG